MKNGKISRRQFLNVAAVSGAALALASCSNDTSSTTSTSTSTTTSTSSDSSSSDVIEVNYWFCIGSDLEAVVQEQVEDFNISQSEIHVTATFNGYYGDTSTKVQQALVAGTQPEIVMLERGTVPQYHAVGALEDLTPYIENDGFDIDSFNKGLMEFSFYDGQTVSLPLNRSTPVMFYNKDALTAAGLDPESPPSTWDEVIEMGAALTIGSGDSTEQYGIEFPLEYVFQSLIPQASGTLLNEDLTDIGFNNQSGLDAFEYLLTLRDAGTMKVPPAVDSYTVAKQDFYNSTVALMVESTASVKGSIDATAGLFEMGAAFLPKRDQYAVHTGGGNIVMLAQCSDEQKAAAWEFIKFIYSEESGAKFVVDTGYVPVTETIKNSDAVQAVWEEYPQYKVGYDQLDYVVEPGQHANWSEVSSALTTYVQAVVMEDMYTPQEALDLLSAEASAILQA